MRIALLSMDYPPRMAGGTTIHTRALALALLAEGHEVHVVAARTPDAPNEEEREGVLVHRVRNPYTAWSATYTGRLVPDLDVVHGHGDNAYGHLRMRDFPTVVKMHSTWYAELGRYRELGSGVGTLMAMRAHVRMDKYCARNADHLICITEVIAGETNKAYGVPRDRMTVVHNGVDLSAFREAAAERDATRDALGLDGLTVMYAGRLVPHKGVSDLISAMEGLDARLLVVGDGPSRGELEAQAERLGVRAKFTGFIDHGQVPAHYAAADIVCYPSLYEPLGNVVLEAMAAGRPIVCTDAGGMGEVYEPGSGALVSPGDVAGIRDALTLLVEDEAARRAAGAKGLETAPAFGWDRVARTTVEVCERVLASRA
ncbi:MAG: glycosyltransferase family 4 protein [Thermoplasmata archaeon]|nr:MAG: glycosyltransferase family 4 protein [Thermoplasmata archaeon]